MLRDQMIDLEWIKSYIDNLLAFAERIGPDTTMGKAAMLRADNVMDLVKAWQEENDTLANLKD